MNCVEAFCVRTRERGVKIIRRQKDNTLYCIVLYCIVIAVLKERFIRKLGNLIIPASLYDERTNATYTRAKRFTVASPIITILITRVV